MPRRPNSNTLRQRVFAYLQSHPEMMHYSPRQLNRKLREAFPDADTRLIANYSYEFTRKIMRAGSSFPFSREEIAVLRKLINEYLCETMGLDDMMQREIDHMEKKRHTLILAVDLLEHANELCDQNHMNLNDFFNQALYEKIKKEAPQKKEKEEEKEEEE